MPWEGQIVNFHLKISSLSSSNFDSSYFSETLNIIKSDSSSVFMNPSESVKVNHS